MDKIYRRSTQSNSIVREIKNNKNRARNVIMNFRVTPTEKELIESRIATSGLSKSKYFIESCLYQKILVRGNVKTFSGMKKDILEIKELIKSSDYFSKEDQEKMETLRIILEIFSKINE